MNSFISDTDLRAIDEAANSNSDNNDHVLTKLLKDIRRENLN